MATSKAKAVPFVSVETIGDNDAKATYTYNGPMGSFEAPGGATVKRGGDVVLTGREVRRAVEYGARFKTKDGADLVTERQIEAREKYLNIATDPGDGPNNTPPPA